jgi:thiopeptide-type bacteriocin biosynthesis protein
MPVDGCRWLSAHLHVDGAVYGPAADRAILDAVAPVAAECLRRRWARCAFFLRYTAGGPHLRLRLLGRPGDLGAHVRPLIEDRVAAGVVRGVDWVPYEPELDRYGGPAGVEVAERLFADSSRLAIELLAGLAADDRAARLGKALLAMLTLLHVFVGEREAAAVTIRRYGQAYLAQQVPDPDRGRRLARAFEGGLDRQADTLAAYVEATWEALERRSGLPPALERYRRRLGAARRRLRAVFERRLLLDAHGAPWARFEPAAAAIFPSYLHMTNNRLGVGIQEEVYLAVVAHGTLGAGAARALA